MPASILIGARTSPAVAASTTLYYSLGNGFTGAAALDTTEAWAQTPFRTAGVITKCWIRVGANDRAGSTYKIRINGAYGNASISITASTTGEFSDGSSSDSIAVDDLVCMELITGAGGTTFVIRCDNALFTPTNSSLMLSRFISHNSAGGSFSAASTSYYSHLAGDVSSMTTEASGQTTIRTTGTLNSLTTYISANARSSTTTIGSRKNTAAGALSISVGAGLTGLFTDYSNSDSLVSGDLSNYFLTTGTGSGAFLPRTFASEFITTNYIQQVIGGGSAVVSMNQATTTRLTLGFLGTANSTSAAQTDCLALFTISRMGLNITTNGNSSTSTATLMKEGVGVNNVVSIPATTTGLMEDTTHSDVMSATTDGLCIEVVMGAGGTTCNVAYTSLLLQNGTPPSANTYNALFFGAGP